MTYPTVMKIIESSSCPGEGTVYGDCYLFTSKVPDTDVGAKQCTTGKLIEENTVMLPSLLLGKNAHQVSATVRCLNFDSYHHSRFYVDFSHVERIDSGGIGALILLRKKIIPRTVAICLINIKPDIYRILSMCNLDKIFTLKG